MDFDAYYYLRKMYSVFFTYDNKVNHYLKRYRELACSKHFSNHRHESFLSEEIFTKADYLLL